MCECCFFNLHCRQKNQSQKTVYESVLQILNPSFSFQSYPFKVCSEAGFRELHCFTPFPLHILQFHAKLKILPMASSYSEEWMTLILLESVLLGKSLVHTLWLLPYNKLCHNLFHTSSYTTLLKLKAFNSASGSLS